MPIGVVIGPLSATLFALTDASVSVGQRRAGGLHHVDARFAHVPVERDARRFEHPARRLGQLGAGAVAGDERHAVRHAAGQRTRPFAHFRFNRSRDFANRLSASRT